MVHAIIFDKLGGPEVLKVTEEYELPERQSGEIIIKIHSTSVNPIDCLMRVTDQLGTKLPRVLGADIAGTVTEDGKKLKKGDRIYAMTDRFAGPKQDGSYAELAYVVEDWAAPAPKTLSLETETGAVPLVALTAYQLLDCAKLQPGARVLVHAASGGVGVFAVQLAKQLFKAFVVGTTGPKNIDFVKSLGADEVVNYRTEDFASIYKDPAKHFDAILDVVGGETEDKSYALLTKGGTYSHLVTGGTSQPKIEAGKKWTDKRYNVTTVQPNGEQLQIIAELIDAGNVKVHIEKVWPLEEAAEAHREVEAGHARGKHVLQVVK